MTYRLNRRTVIGGRRGARRRRRHAAIRARAIEDVGRCDLSGHLERGATATVICAGLQGATGAAVTQSIVLGTDQVARLTAAKGNKPPFDVAFFDTPQVLDAAKEGLIVEYPAAKSPNFSDAASEIPGQMGPEDHDAGDRHRLQPEEDHDAAEELGRIVGSEIQGPRRPDRAQQPARHRLPRRDRIGSRAAPKTDFEPAFKALRELLPNVGAIGANLGAYATLWQQEQIDIAPYNFNFVQTLKAKDVPVEFAIPTTGAGRLGRPACTSSPMPQEPDLAVKYIDLHLDPAIQAQMLKPPYDVIPTNAKVTLEGADHQVARQEPGRSREGPRLRLGEAQSAARRADRALQPRDQGLSEAGA